MKDRSDLTKEEQARVRTALRFLHRRIGDWATLGSILNFKGGTLKNVALGRTVTASLAFRIARLASVSVDDLLAGKFPHPNACPHCGHCPEQPA